MPVTTPQWLADAVVRAMQERSYTLATGKGEINIVYVEGLNLDGSANDNAPNQFNDVRLAIRDGAIVGAWEGTTEPSKRWTVDPMNPAGAARIKFGQYTAWQVGIHHNSHEALVQTGGEVTVCRDANKDYKRDGDALDTGYFGINQHWGYDLPKNDLGTSSAGCLVGRTTAGHKEFMAIVKSDPRYVADPKFVFSAAVLPASAVLAYKAAPLAKPAPAPVASPKLISQAAIDLIVAEEVTSKSYYESTYRHPDWPGAGSGVTIGIGYDVGAGVNNKAQLRADWGGVISDRMIAALEPAIGVTGERANALADKLIADVDVPWDAAMTVFERVDVPRWYATCAKALPNFELLSPDCKGALVSLAYNRGASFSLDGSRYTEMRNIRAHMAAKEFDKIPAEIRSMKRIWAGQGLSGLLERRDREADLFQRGLTQPVTPQVTPPAQPPVPPSKPAGTAGGAVIVAGGAAGTAAAQAGLSGWTIAAIVIGTVVLAVVAYELVRRFNK